MGVRSWPGGDGLRPDGWSAFLATRQPARFREWSVSAASQVHPHDIWPAGDGTVWYTAQFRGAAGRLNTATGAHHEIPLGTGSAPHGVIADAAGNVWITDQGLDAIVRVDRATEAVTVYRIPAPDSNPNTAVFDRRGVLWFTGASGYYGRVDPASGRVDAWPAARGGGVATTSGPYGITVTGSWSDSARAGPRPPPRSSRRGEPPAILNRKEGAAVGSAPACGGRSALRERTSAPWPAAPADAAMCLGLARRRANSRRVIRNGRTRRLSFDDTVKPVLKSRRNVEGVARDCCGSSQSVAAAESGQMIDVVVVAPIRLHRESLAAALESAGKFRVLGEAGRLDEGLTRMRELPRPAVGLLDGPTLADLLQAPLANVPQPKLVAIGVSDEKAVAWIEAGASGCVPPAGSLEDVIVAIERVASDGFAASPEVAAHLASRVRRLAAESPLSIAQSPLTCREAEVLELLGEGLSNKQIARRLSIELQTVKNHVHNLLVKLGVSRRAEAVARLRRQSGRDSSDYRPG